MFGALSLCQSNRRWWILLGAFVQHGKLASRSRNESLASLDQKGQKAKHFCWFMVNKAWNSSIPRSIKMLWRLWCQRLLKLTLQVIKLSSDFKIQHVGHGKCMSFLQHFCTKPLILWKWAPFAMARYSTRETYESCEPRRGKRLVNCFQGSPGVFNSKVLMTLQEINFWD